MLVAEREFDTTLTPLRRHTDLVEPPLERRLSFAKFCVFEQFSVVGREGLEPPTR